MAEVMISDLDHKDIETEKAVFEGAGVAWELHQCKTEADVIAHCRGARVLLNQYAPMNETVFRALGDLKCVVRYGVGYDNINIEDATRYGVQVCNVPDYGINEVADHALSLMLSLVRKIHMVVPLTRAGVWDYRRTIPIHRASEQTVGIVGVGRIGTAFAKRVNALGYRVIGCDIRYGGGERHPLDFIELVSFEEVLRRSDIISIHASYNETSRMLFNAGSMGRMKAGSYLVNVSRGGIIDEDALADVVSSGHLAGAALDVSMTEPLGRTSKLYEVPGILVTPHMAWYSEESAVDLKGKCAEEAVRFLRGEGVRNPINNPMKVGNL